MKNKLNFDINVMNKITKNLLLNLNQNIKNYHHNKIISKIENFKLIQYFFARSIVKPTATVINNKILFKNTISSKSWPKLINNIIYTLLLYTRRNGKISFCFKILQLYNLKTIIIIYIVYITACVNFLYKIIVQIFK